MLIIKKKLRTNNFDKHESEYFVITDNKFIFSSRAIIGRGNKTDYLTCEYDADIIFSEDRSTLYTTNKINLHDNS